MIGISVNSCQINSNIDDRRSTAYISEIRDCNDSEVKVIGYLSKSSKSCSQVPESLEAHTDNAVRCTSFGFAHSRSIYARNAKNGVTKKGYCHSNQPAKNARVITGFSPEAAHHKSIQVILPQLLVLHMTESTWK